MNAYSGMKLGRDNLRHALWVNFGMLSIVRFNRRFLDCVLVCRGVPFLRGYSSINFYVSTSYVLD